jgi:hemerythrin-like domain-containing protein
MNAISAIALKTPPPRAIPPASLHEPTGEPQRARESEYNEPYVHRRRRRDLLHDVQRSQECAFASTRGDGIGPALCIRMPIRIGQQPDHSFDEPLGLLSDCHRRIEHFLHVLEAIADRAAERPITAAERADLDAAVTYFATAAPKHTADEEESVFPRLRQSTDPLARQALETIERLESDHVRADAYHRAIDATVRQWMSAGTLDAAAQATLREHLRALRAIYDAHIAIEDRELFPAAGRALSASDLRAIGREMAARRSRPA